MKKIFITLFFGFILCNISFAESYYFKECQLTEKASGDYIIDFDNNVIRVSLKATNGNYQEFTDKMLKHGDLLAGSGEADHVEDALYEAWQEKQSKYQSKYC